MQPTSSAEPLPPPLSQGCGRSRGRAPISNCGYDRAANEIDLVKLSI